MGTARRVRSYPPVAPCQQRAFGGTLRRGGCAGADMRRVGSDERVAYIPSDERCRPGSPTPARRLHWTVYAVVTVVLFSVACSAQAFRAMLPSAHYVVSAKPAVTETMLRSSAIHWQRKASQEPVIPPAQRSEPVIPPAQQPVIPPAQQSAQQWEWAGFAQLPSHIVKEATWFDEERTLPALFKDVPEGGIVWMSFANKAFETLTYNWAAHVYMLRKERQLVLASLDGALQVQLRRHRLPFFSFSMAGTTSADLRSNVTEFRLMGALKGELVLQARPLSSPWVPSRASSCCRRSTLGVFSSPNYGAGAQRSA